MKSEGWDEQAAMKLLKNIDRKVKDNDKINCDKPITEAELCLAVKDLKVNKAPGEDGLSPEFYKRYWPIIKNEFCEVIKEIELNQCLCNSM